MAYDRNREIRNSVAQQRFQASTPLTRHADQQARLRMITREEVREVLASPETRWYCDRDHGTRYHARLHGLTVIVGTQGADAVVSAYPHSREEQDYRAALAREAGMPESTIREYIY